MPTDRIFENRPNIEGWDMDNAYALGTLLRCLDYTNNAALDAWKNLYGFSSFQRENPGFPPSYVTMYHRDGVVVAFDGLRNYSQFMQVVHYSNNVDMYQVAGKVLFALRNAWVTIENDIRAKISVCPNNANIVITGWSFGGALACVAAYRLAAYFGSQKVRYAVSFGAPKPGNQAFADSMPVPLLAVENAGDMVVRLPNHNATLGWAAGNGIFSSWVMPGQPLEMPENGDAAFSRSWRFRSPDLPLIYNAISSGFQDPTTFEHRMKAYCSRLSYQTSSLHGVGGGRNSECIRLNRALDLGVVPTDLITQLPVVSADPAPEEVMPTPAQLQTIPANPGAPGDTSGTPDTRMVGEFQRFTVASTVSTAARADATGPMQSKDADLIRDAIYQLRRVNKNDAIMASGRASKRKRWSHRRRLVVGLQIALRRIAERDTRNATGNASRTRSTSRYIIDPAATSLGVAFNTVRDRTAEFLGVTNNPEPFVNDPITFAARVRMVYEHLQDALVRASLRDD